MMAGQRNLPFGDFFVNKVIRVMDGIQWHQQHQRQEQQPALFHASCVPQATCKLTAARMLIEPRNPWRSAREVRVL